MSKNGLSISIDFLVFLGITFIILKLTKTIGWSWVWVTFPLWGMTLTSLIFMLFVVVIEIRSGK